MTKVIVRPGESLASALRRFRRAVQAKNRSWVKTRPGYFEKPSVLRRKKERLRKMNAQLKSSLKLNLALEKMFARGGPFAAGR